MNPARYSLSHRLGQWLLNLIAALVLLFLIFPLIIIIPLSFNSEPFFSITPEMLRLEPEAFSLRWYQQLYDASNWHLAIRNSFLIGGCATLLATTLGTLGALGLSQPHMPGRRLITALLLSPMIVPVIILAAGMFFFYAPFNLTSSFTGLILAHATLGIPFVVITVTATLTGLDPAFYRAALSLGASPWHAFRTVVFPAIRPGIITGAIFAFITSFDEIIIVLFLAGPEQKTIPREMFSGLREQINPSILAVATVLIAFSALFLLCLSLLQRGSRRLKAQISPPA
ncbi:MAG TPA: ABC transporter permease [Paenalcaligenes sp.]|nr:ABC transporter permease [Paenalcaligenes sp.]HLR81849.1 ABC transporter permease [Paenalcaligenes sp.]